MSYVIKATYDSSPATEKTFNHTRMAELYFLGCKSDPDCSWATMTHHTTAVPVWAYTRVSGKVTSPAGRMSRFEARGRLDGIRNDLRERINRLRAVGLISCTEHRTIAHLEFDLVALDECERALEALGD